MKSREWYLTQAILWIVFFALFYAVKTMNEHTEALREQRIHDEWKEKSDIKDRAWEESCLSYIRWRLPGELSGEYSSWIPKQYLKYCKGRQVKVMRVCSDGPDNENQLKFSGELTVNGKTFTFSLSLHQRWLQPPTLPDKELDIKNFVISGSKD